MKISQLAKETGLTTEAIRFYEKKGLLEPPERLGNNYRVYGPSHLDALNFVRYCRTLDMTLEEIAVLKSNMDATDPAQAQVVHQMVDRQLLVVEKKMNELTLLKGLLTQIQTRCHGEHDLTHPCGIIEEMLQQGHSER